MVVSAELLKLKYPTSVVILNVEVIEILVAVGGIKLRQKPALITLETDKATHGCTCP